LRFAPDTENSLAFAVALINTHPGATKSGIDELATIDQLTHLVAEHGYSGRVDHDARELVEVRATRQRLRELWTIGRDEAAHEVNDMLRDAGALPYLVRHDAFDWHLHATAADAPLAERIRVEVALALVDVIRSAANERMRACAGSDCTGLFIDLSRNGSKRFCSVRCGNRMNMIAFRERAIDP
jgi:predicted RNA-binding Zn ribbon-like protein